MRKFVYVLLVLAMVGSIVASFFFYASPANKAAADDPFADVPSPVIKSFKFADASDQDVSAVDFTNVTEMDTLSFNTMTTWPAADKLPKEYSPETALKQGRYLGLGLAALHGSGITGKGVSVAVIDKPIDRTHEAFGGNIQYVEVTPGNEAMTTLNYHGAAVASILAGKDGVAPGARLYYFAVVDDDQPYARYTEAMNRILDLNKTLPASERIRIVTVAAGVDPFDAVSGTPGAMDWASAMKAAQDAGMIVMYAGTPDIDLTGAGCLPSKDRDDPQNYQAWSWTAAKQQVAQKLKDAKVDSWEKARSELVRLLTGSPDLNPLQAEAINTFIYLMESYKTGMNYDSFLATMVGDLTNSVAFPADYITVASTDSANSYAYYGSGGLSWATPYAAGILALGLQVKPTATPAELLKAITDTGTPFVTGGKLVNPVGFIQALR